MAALAIHYTPKTTIELTSILGRKFFRKKDYLLDVGSTWEVFKALRSTVEGFSEEVDRLARLGMKFAIIRNGENVGTSRFDLGGTKSLKIVPVISGSKRAGVLQTILGVVMIAASAFITYASGGAASPFASALAAAGYATAIGGAIQLISSQQGGLKQSAAPENRPSYAFGSARNTTASGNPVPICIGHRRWGGIIISASIHAEDKA